MYPVLFTIGPLPISSFGVFASIGFVIGAFYVFREAKDDLVLLRYGIVEEAIVDIIVLASFAGFVGARFFHIITHLQDFGVDALRWVLFTYFPGLNLLGAIISGLFFLIILAKTRKLPLSVLLDYASLGFLVGAPFGFLGRFLTDSKNPYFHGVEALIIIALFLLLLYAKKKGIIRKDGFLALTFLSIFAIVSFGFEFIWSDKVNVGFLTVNQWTSFILGVSAFGFLLHSKRNTILLFFRKHKLLW